jgi:hypothetical protein
MRPAAADLTSSDDGLEEAAVAQIEALFIA